jgi:hypothetical protein
MENQTILLATTNNEDDKQQMTTNVVDDDEQRVLKEIRDHGAPTSTTGEVEDDCKQSPFKKFEERFHGYDTCGAFSQPFDTLTRVFKYQIRGTTPVKLRLDNGMIELRSKRSIVVPASNHILCSTGIKIKKDPEDHVTYVFLGVHAEGGVKTFLNNENELIQSDDIEYGKDVVIKIKNLSTTSVQLSPGSYLGTVCPVDNKYISKLEKISVKRVKIENLNK